MPVGQIIDDGGVRPPQKKPSPVMAELLALLAAPTSTPTPTSETSGPTGTSLAADYAAYLNPPAPDPNSRAGALAQGYASQGAAASLLAEQAAEQKIVDDRNMREDALGLGSPLPLPKMPEIGLDQQKAKPRGKVRSMTEAEYLALDPQQKAAVDFNTQLVEAVRRDRRLNRRGKYDDVTEQEQENYDAAVEDTFGDDGGSVKFAPETVALLSQIGYKDEAADLDDFLQLRAAITSKDLNYLSDQGAKAQWQSQALQGTPTQDRLAANSTLAANTARLQETLAKGTELLQTMGATAYTAREDRVGQFGGTARNSVAGLGFGQTEVDTVFKTAFDALAKKKDGEDPARVLEFLQARNLLDGFMSYAETKTQQSEEYGIKLGDVAGVKYRSPEEFRKLLGLDTSKGGY